MGRQGDYAVINVTVIALGKLREKYMRDFSDEYLKRLSAYCKINIVEISPEPLSENPSEKEIKAALSKEAALINKKVLAGAYVFSLCIEGKEMSSENFAKKISELAVRGKSSLVFIIGSSFGLDEKVKELADEKFSMSEMTFPHRMARVMLLEQLYRAFQIINGGKYHK